MSRGPVRVGVLGCGVIGDVYIANLGGHPEDVTVVACADLDLARAEVMAAKHDVPRVLAVNELLRDPEVELVVNLTWPAAHVELNLAALEAGKHVYSEKPLALTLDEARQTLDEAERRGLRLGCAPDTLLADGNQTARRLVDSGEIGAVLDASSWFYATSPGPAARHPAPDFFYQQGAGPLFDMAPYPLSTLVNLLGPIRRAWGRASRQVDEVVVGEGPRAGERLRIDVPLSYAAMVEFVAGPTAHIVTTWESAAGRGMLPVQVSGTAGTLWTPNPNRFQNAVRLRKSAADGDTGVEVAPQHRNTASEANLRGLGVWEMAVAMREDRPHRCSAALGYHVLEAMMAIEESAQTAAVVEIASTCERPDPMPEVLTAESS
ncbi:Gfo/Idh/MocA family oxidoreductase [Actinopolymorpha sp. B9G3]|uniref:Gfo/Idh/MocA family protein n=1 Tax=Actinopolymorpha sp. B9G3 TaxID=3158970 RepID=UPI0032D92656